MAIYLYRAYPNMDSALHCILSTTLSMVHELQKQSLVHSQNPQVCMHHTLDKIPVGINDPCKPVCPNSAQHPLLCTQVPGGVPISHWISPVYLRPETCVNCYKRIKKKYKRIIRIPIAWYFYIFYFDTVVSVSFLKVAFHQNMESGTERSQFHTFSVPLKYQGAVHPRARPNKHCAI